MPFDLNLVGQSTLPHDYCYTCKDMALYALGIGAKKSELEYLYEARGPKTYPCFAVIPTFAPVFEIVGKAGGVFADVIHSAQKVRLTRALPAAAKLQTTATLSGVYDLKKFAIVVAETHTSDDLGPLFSTTWQLLFRNAGGFGGKLPPREPSAQPPQGKEPDFVFSEPTSPEQALLYRLSGDINPLHADPQIAKAAGFDAGPILHGLCTFGFMVRHVILAACAGDASRVRAMEASFSRPVWPGDALTTRAWWLSGDRLAVTVHAEGRPEAVITKGSIELAPQHDK
jgi:acyl dehydratase